MTIIEQIKAEIERLYDGEAPKHDQQCDFDDGYFTGIGAIAQFIDTIESEKHIPSALNGGPSLIRQIREEESLPNDLEEAAKRYAHCPFTDDDGNFHEDAIDGTAYHDFIEGAKWMSIHGNDIKEL